MEIQEERFSREIRFAVVMYGGVSLSVYINGVAQELFRMVRATAPKDGDPLDGRFHYHPAKLSAAERVYRELGAELDARFVVDILSGTSAGGINAIFLAKALVEKRSLDGLKQLWVDEADIATLLNDRGSLAGLPADLLDDPPQSVLNGHRFYRKLLDAFQSMDRSGPPGASCIDELDLYVTATDFEGVNLPLPLVQLEEPHHRKVFHFRYDKQVGGRNDFKVDENPMLAFAARCTASFPAAFPPFCLEDADLILRSHPDYRGQEPRTWEEFFSEYPKGAEYRKRFFVDGGYLDNKPFEAVMRAVGDRRRALLPVDRKLLYVEPHPSVYGADRQRERPDVIANLMAVSSLPRVETIRAQLEDLEKFNQNIQRASIMTERLNENLEEDMRAAGKERKRQVAADDWARADLGEMIKRYGVSYGGYHRLKVSRLTDWVAERVDEALAPERQHRAPGPSQATRALIGAWRTGAFSRYHGESVRRETENLFLVDFDLAYRLRRIEYERFKLREVLESEAKAKAFLELAGKPTTSVSRWAGERRALIDLQGKLQVIHSDLRKLERTCASTIGPEIAARFQEVVRDHENAPAAQRPEVAARVTALIAPLREHLKKEFTRTGDEHTKVLGMLEEEPGDTLLAAVKAALGHFHTYFAELDMVRFPILSAMGTGEMDPIEVIRISAVDTELAGTRGVEKLAGIRVGHFGAFFDVKWRRNDILWGRLDAAERLMSALLPAATEPEVRDRWLTKAFTAIITEELSPYTCQPKRVQELASRLVSELGREADDVEPVARRAVELVQDTLWAEIEAEEDAKKKKNSISAYLGQRLPEPLGSGRILRLLSRSTLIFRKLVDGVALSRDLDGSVAVSWLVRALGVSWGVIELAIPGVKQNILSRALSLAMLVGAVLAVAGGVLGRSPEIAIGAVLFVGAGLVRFAGAALAAVATGKTRSFEAMLAALFLAGAAVAIKPLGERASFPTPQSCGGKCTYGMLDLQLAQTPERLKPILAEWTTLHEMDNVRAAVGWDFGFILAYVAGLAGLAWLLRGLFQFLGYRGLQQLMKVAAAAALVAGACDAIENGLLLLELQGLTAPYVTWPEFAFASLKWGLALGSGVANAAGLAVALISLPVFLAAVVRLLRNRRRTASRLTSAG